jgi:hypothetical protein
MLKKHTQPLDNDKSWQTYRDWVTSTVKMLNPNAVGNTTETQWQTLAQGFWGKDKEVKSLSPIKP